jgi:glycosyltransferase involved in cell wall biosynthesis
VVLTARDEEEQLPGTLASVAGWAAEIVVVLDPRSRDRTGELARAAGARVIEHPFTGSGAQCNWGLEQAANRWVLVVDADERVTSSLQLGIVAAVADPHHEAFAVRRINFAFGHRLRFGDWGRDWVVRLVDREHARFEERAVHGAVQASSVGRVRGELLHDTLRSLEQYLPKLHDYALRGAADLAAAGRRASVSRAIGHAEWRFFRSLFLRFGILDGPAGWAVAVLLAHGTFLKWLAVWDQQCRPRPAGAATAASRAPSPEPRTPSFPGSQG